MALSAASVIRITLAPSCPLSASMISGLMADGLGSGSPPQALTASARRAGAIIGTSGVCADMVTFPYPARAAPASVPEPRRCVLQWRHRNGAQLLEETCQ